MMLMKSWNQLKQKHQISLEAFKGSSVDPSYGPRFDCLAQICTFFYLNCYWEKDENKTKRGQDRPIFKKHIRALYIDF